MPSKSEQAATITSLLEQLRAAGEMHRSATQAFTRAIAERDHKLQALTAKRPMTLRLAAKEAGVPYSSAFDWEAKGWIQPLPDGFYDANAFCRFAAAKGYPVSSGPIP